MRRVSVGGALARIARGAFAAAAARLRDEGRIDPDEPFLPSDLATAAWG